MAQSPDAELPAVPLRLARPRIAPVTDAEATPEQAAAMAPFAGWRKLPVLNIFRTLAHNPEALTAFQAWGSQVMSRRNSLPPRQREIIVLRVGARCRAGYEFAQHARIGARAGLSAAEIARLRDGDESGWAPEEALLVRASDEIVADHFVNDATWTALAAHFSEQQLMDIVFTASQYVLVSTILNSFGVQLEA